MSEKDSVLVLNANFQPINVCDMRRAFALVMTDKASLVVNGRGVIHSAQKDYPRPSIIRLQKMVSLPRVVVKLTRREIFRRDDYTCQYCGKHTLSLTIDHVIPRHLGGKHAWTNVVAACPSCNHRKGGKMLEEAHLQIRHLPKEPPSSAIYTFGRHLAVFSEWEPFLSGW